MKTTNDYSKVFCYSGQSWRVFKDNKFVGYVVSPSEMDALRKASEKFGSNTRIERVTS